MTVTPVTVPVTGPAGIDVAAYIAAVALAGAAAWFSVRGMAVLFPGSPLSAVGMAVAMEAAKLVTVGWLARRWRITAWIWRFVLVMLVAGLALINAAGVYAQLVQAHVGQRAEMSNGTIVQSATVDAKIAAQQHTVADLDARVRQIDSAIAKLPLPAAAPGPRWPPWRGSIRSAPGL